MKVWLGAMAMLLLLGAAPRIAPPTAEELAEYRDEGITYRSYPPEPLAGWETDLRRVIPGISLDGAGDVLAPRYGLTRDRMRRLTRLWLTVRVREFALQRDPAATAELRRQLLALLAEARQSRLVFQAVAESLDRLSQCSAADFETLMAGSTDPAGDAWDLAGAAECGENFLRAAGVAPNRAMPALIRLAHYGSLGPREALPLYEWLTRPAALARIAEADRPVLAGRLYRRYVRLLFHSGLVDRAIVLVDSLPDDLRRRVLSADYPAFSATVDGLAVAMGAEQRREETVQLEVAAAYALAGRTAEAEALFASIPYLSAARRGFACAWPAGDREIDRGCANRPIEDRFDQTVDLLLLDHLLHHPADDPYPFAEIAFSGMGFWSPGAAVAELRCRVFAEPQYAGICRGARGAWRHPIRRDRADDDEKARNAAALAALALPGYEGLHAAFGAEFDRLLANVGPDEADGRPQRPTTPALPPFAELALPETFRGGRPGPTRPPRHVAPLPDGFRLVRFERSGQRAVAISVSQTYDPTGEVSQGGYWVHLSDDGGRHWQRPLYTGLAQRFPFVVPETSRMPLLNGDRLDIEVEVFEIDTATITYPPVALRSRRRGEDVYIQVPLGDLARDSDGDGFTDLAERNLLLDRARSDGGTPFIVGSDAGAACGSPAPDAVAVMGLLEQVFSISSGTIVEGLDRPPGVEGMVSSWRNASAAPGRPIFISGEPRGYRCLRPNRLTIVYGEDDIAELERYRPDFHAVEIGPIVYNRARDRGYASWSAGWTGGTYRLRLVDGRWIFESIGSWIT